MPASRIPRRSSRIRDRDKDDIFISRLDDEELEFWLFEADFPRADDGFMAVDEYRHFTEMEIAFLIFKLAAFSEGHGYGQRALCC